MARKNEHTGETLEQIETLGDRLVEWVSTNPAIVLGTALGVLVIAGGYGFAASYQSDAKDQASAELARVDDEFRSAMGATSSTFEIPEPANADAARVARGRFAGEYRELSRRYAGTETGSLAALQEGHLNSQLGEWEKAIEIWQAAEADASGIPKALLLSSLGAGFEAQEQWAEAAEAYESAAAIGDFPLRFRALADAARCFVAAEQPDQALLAFQRLETDAGDYQAPEHVQALLAELRAGQATP